jgi:hypothetical protein
MATSQEYIFGRLQDLCPDAGQGKEFALYVQIGLGSYGSPDIHSYLRSMAFSVYHAQAQAASSEARVRDIRREGDNILITIL